MNYFLELEPQLKLRNCNVLKHLPQLQENVKLVKIDKLVKLVCFGFDLYCLTLRIEPFQIINNNINFEKKVRRLERFFKQMPFCLIFQVRSTDVDFDVKYLYRSFCSSFMPL
jgi:hypothetical protein